MPFLRLQGFHHAKLPNMSLNIPGTSLELATSFRDVRAPSSAYGLPRRSSSREVPCPYSVFQLQTAVLWPHYRVPPPCAFRFSQPPDALVRPEPAGLVSCRLRSWGSPFRALFLPCRRIPSPDPLPSCCWVPGASECAREHRQLQGLAPHRESVALGQWFRLTEARSSPGLLPSRA